MNNGDGILFVSSGKESCRPDKPVRTVKCYEHMLHFVLSGQGFFNGKKIKAGEGFLCLEGEHVSYMPDPINPWTYVWINTAGEAARSLLLKIPSQNGIFKWPVEQDLSLFRDFPPLTIENADVSAELRSKSLFYYFLSILGCFPSEKFQKISEQVRSFIDHNITLPLSIASIAKTFNISESHLRFLFHKDYNMSPREYITIQKLNLAKEMLLKNQDITFISLSLGFSKCSDFSNLFKKYIGISPSKYRDAILNTRR